MHISVVDTNYVHMYVVCIYQFVSKLLPTMLSRIELVVAVVRSLFAPYCIACLLYLTTSPLMLFWS